VSRVLLATKNLGKVAELQRILTGFVLEGAAYEPGPETGASFADNALAKAREGVALTGLPTVADDSGLTVDALNGMPGILSARWAGRHGDDRANLQLVLAQLTDTPPERRGAAFVCGAAYALPDGHQVTSAELSPEQKDAISHRGQAFRELAPLLVSALG
jgi:XTP/dITP diphosphohydrolase